MSMASDANVEDVRIDMQCMFLQPGITGACSLDFST